MQPLGPCEAVQLSDKQGLLILDIESDTAIETLWISTSHPLPVVQPGRQVWVVRLRAGLYRWRELYIENLFGGRSFRYELPEDDEYAFRVEAGRLNYPGQLTILRVRHPRMSGSWYWGPELVIRNRNRAGSTLRELRKTHPLLLRTHPVHYSGSTEDLFLDHFTEAMQRSDPDRAIESAGCEG
jgi:hypothetical protein